MAARSSSTTRSTTDPASAASPAAKPTSSASSPAAVPPASAPAANADPPPRPPPRPDRRPDRREPVRTNREPDVAPGARRDSHSLSHRTTVSPIARVRPHWTHGWADTKSDLAARSSERRALPGAREGFSGLLGGGD